MSFDPVAKKPTVESSAADRISNLPSCITDNILRYLPLRDAVRTSVLSTQWRYKWVTIPHLDVDWDFKKSLVGNWDTESIFDRLLLWHKGTIVKFSVKGSDMASDLAILVWVQLLLNHHIEYLALHWSALSQQTAQYLLPNDLYHFEHLKHLYLDNVVVKPPLGFKGFSKLINLELLNVIIEFEELKVILSKCPMLEFLHLVKCEGTMQWLLVIDAPNLKHFRFWGNFSSICFGNTSLEEISIGKYDTFGLRSECGSKGNLIEVFSQVPSLKTLCFDCTFLEFLALGGVPQNLPSSLNHLTLLKIDYFDVGSMDQVS